MLEYVCSKHELRILMASVDKISVRNEVGRLKTDFEQICSEGKVSIEIKIIMHNMFMIIELMLSIFLERSTRKGDIVKSGVWDFH